MISFAETYKLELKQLERTILDLLRDPILKTLPQLFTLIDILTGNNFFDKFSIEELHSQMRRSGLLQPLD
jgi:hypothetical protein